MATTDAFLTTMMIAAGSYTTETRIHIVPGQNCNGSIVKYGRMSEQRATSNNGSIFRLLFATPMAKDIELATAGSWQCVVELM